MESTPESSPIPPADPRHHRFAILVLKYRYYVDAYLEAGFNCSRATAYVYGHRLSRRPDVANYIAAVRHLDYDKRYRAHNSAVDSHVQALRKFKRL